MQVSVGAAEMAPLRRLSLQDHHHPAHPSLPNTCCAAGGKLFTMVSK
jgi:hypothetical protein